MKYPLTEKTAEVVLNAPFIVVADIETTGFSGAYEDIIEIGAVLLDTQNRKITSHFNRIIRPLRRKSVPAKIEELTGVTNEMVKREGIGQNQALEEFHQFIGDYPVAFHNAPFDWDRFLSRDFLAINKSRFGGIAMSTTAKRNVAKLLTGCMLVSTTFSTRMTVSWLWQPMTSLQM